MPATSVSAPGKIILCGEHAVVYDQPAIAIPVLTLCTTTKIFAHPTQPKGEIFVKADALRLAEKLDILPVDDPIRKTIELVKTYFSLESLPACEIHIISTLPVAAGLGSSASLSISIIRALSEFIGHPLPPDQVNTLAFEAEKNYHTHPSGLDNTVITYEKPIYFQRGCPLEFLHIERPFQFIVANTGITASTSEAVSGVRERLQNDPEKYTTLFTQVGLISQHVRKNLASGSQKEIGELLTLNHRYLVEMGVSCSELDRFVEVSINSGALGAKLSGGGLGGNMLALVTSDTTKKVEEALEKAGAKMILKIILPASTEGK